jgi:hypothetical protein
MVAALIQRAHRKAVEHDKWNAALFETKWKQLQQKEGRGMDLYGSAWE